MSNPYPLSIYEIQAGRLPGWANEPILLTIPAGSVTGVLEDFPAMVKLSGSSGKTAADVSKVFTALGSDANRKRICITAGDGLTPCYVEIKEWSTATQTAYLWVRVPRINPGEDTHLYLYYDPLHAEMTGYVGDTGEPAAQAVWNAGYGAVYTKSIPATKKTLYAGEVSGSAPGGAVANALVAFDPIDCTGLTKGNGWLKIDLKCDLPEYLTGGSQLEITSAGGPDTQEWSLTNVHGTYGISSEWRTYYLPLSTFWAGGSELDPARINFIRWYVLMADGAPATTISWRNAEIISIADLPGGTRTHILLDSTANANHGMIYGATLTQGPTGTGLSFDGVDDYVSAPGAAPTDPSSGSASILFTRAWATDDNVTHGIMCIGGYVSGSQVDFKRLQMFKWGGNNQWYFCLANETSMANVNVLDSEIPENVLTYVTMTWANGLVAVYVNGVLAGTFAIQAPLTWLTDSVELGRAYSNSAMIGRIACAQVSSIARSPAWIAATNAALRDELIVYSDPGAPLTLAAYADAYDYLSWTRRYRRPGAWKAQINHYLPAAKEFIPGRLVHFRRNGEDRLGLIETRQISVDTSGRPSEQWTVAGREIIGILGDRLCLHGVSTGTGYDEFAGAAETALRHYVDANAINPDDARRIVPFLALSPTDDGRGGTTTQKARFDVLADLLESICAASGLGYRGRWSWDDRRLYFEVLQGADRSASVKLSPALGNCTIKGYNESTGLAPSVAVVAGQGEAAARVVADVGTGDGLIGLARRERFVDARDLATEAELQQRGAEKLAEDGDTTTLEVEYIQTASYRYGEDFDLGDIVHVEYPDIAAMDARIVEITEEYAREGEKLTLTLGTEWPDLVSLLRTQRKDNVEKRI